MERQTLLQLSGVAAILGGLLRIADSFTAGVVDAHALSFLYFATDVLLLFGLLGIYLVRAKELGLVALSGFAIAVTGILMIRSGWLFGVGGYRLSATVLLVGLTMLSIAMLCRAGTPKWAPNLWLISLASGIAGAAGAGAWAIALAGVTFGAGFVVAGINLLRERGAP